MVNGFTTLAAQTVPSLCPCCCCIEWLIVKWPDDGHYLNKYEDSCVTFPEPGHHSNGNAPEKNLLAGRKKKIPAIWRKGKVLFFCSHQFFLCFFFCCCCLYRSARTTSWQRFLTLCRREKKNIKKKTTSRLPRIHRVKRLKGCFCTGRRPDRWGVSLNLCPKTHTFWKKRIIQIKSWRWFVCRRHVTKPSAPSNLTCFSRSTKKKYRQILENNKPPTPLEENRFFFHPQN